jgi:hypothetical protein
VYWRWSLLPGKNPQCPPVHRKVLYVFPFTDACIPSVSEEPDPRTFGKSRSSRIDITWHSPKNISTRFDVFFSERIGDPIPPGTIMVAQAA